MKVGVICAPGGHLVQALAVVKAFDDQDVFLITYDSDALRNFKHDIVERVYQMKFYGASNPKIVMNLVSSIPKLMKIFSKEKPDILFSTGSEIAIPAFYLAKAFYRTKLIFLETVVRSHRPTLTSRCVAPVSDLLLVQWEHMVKEIGHGAKYVGGLL